MISHLPSSCYSENLSGSTFLLIAHCNVLYENHSAYFGLKYTAVFWCPVSSCPPQPKTAAELTMSSNLSYPRLTPVPHQIYCSIYYTCLSLWSFSEKPDSFLAIRDFSQNLSNEKRLILSISVTHRKLFTVINSLLLPLLTVEPVIVKSTLHNKSHIMGPAFVSGAVQMFVKFSNKIALTTAIHGYIIHQWKLHIDPSDRYFS